MEKEILEMFAVAKKAGDAAAADGGSAEIARCLDALRQLRKFPLTTKELVATKVGKAILCLTKHPQQKIQAAAAELRQHWKNLVIDEASAKNKKSHPPEPPASAAAAASRATATTEKSHNSAATDHSNKSPAAASSPATAHVEKSNKSPAAASSPATARVEKSNKSTAAAITASPAAERSNKSAAAANNASPATERSNKSAAGTKIESLPNGREHAKAKRDVQLEQNSTPKLSSMVKCNDEARDKVRELLAEALARVAGEVSAELKSEAAAADPIRVAVTVECRMFEKLGKSTGPQKARYRSILFNMRDAKNPDLRRRVLLGHVTAAGLVDMAAEDMASDERKRQNQQIKDKAIFECERGAPAKATTDQFKCGRCGKRKTTYYQLQTRSADEPMTTFVTCVECNNHWKFC
ncbi:transcription elongation factor TFIIS-like [Wolffia australiana]